jgi:hypothetical protein
MKIRVTLSLLGSAILLVGCGGASSDAGSNQSRAEPGPPAAVNFEGFVLETLRQPENLMPRELNDVSFTMSDSPAQFGHAF